MCLSFDALEACVPAAAVLPVRPLCPVLRVCVLCVAVARSGLRFVVCVSCVVSLLPPSLSLWVEARSCGDDRGHSCSSEPADGGRHMYTRAQEEGSSADGTGQPHTTQGTGTTKRIGTHTHSRAGNTIRPASLARPLTRTSTALHSRSPPLHLTLTRITHIQHGRRLAAARGRETVLHAMQGESDSKCNLAGRRAGTRRRASAARKRETAADGARGRIRSGRCARCVLCIRRVTRLRAVRDTTHLNSSGEAARRGERLRVCKLD